MLSGKSHLHLVLERRDPARNMARFYVLSVEPTLFGDDVALVREWGRLGRQGRRRMDLFADAIVAAEALDAWLQRKIRRGYEMRVKLGSSPEPGLMISDASLVTPRIPASFP